MPTPMFTGELEFLSNFDTTSFFVSQLNTDVPSGEHAFNALKTLSDAERRHVLAAPTPAESKKRGRHVTLRPEWDTGVRIWAMQRVLMAKFSVPELSARLQATGSLRLVETNRWHDQFWGDCFCDRHAQAPGQNMLGELIMAIRVHQRVS